MKSKCWLIVAGWLILILHSIGAVGLIAADLEVAPAKRGSSGALVHAVRSSLQAGPTEIRVLLPDAPPPEERLPVVFVLPVEAGRENRYGDGLLEVQKQDLPNKYNAIFVAPTFFHLPWYVDHATDEQIKQETYFVEQVVPYVLNHYPVEKERAGHLLLGFSKSGWGAVSLLLRHPEMFERAAAWDAPFMMDKLGKYGTSPVFGADEVLEQYALPMAIKKYPRPASLNDRLIITGYGGFRPEHERFHALLDEREIQHVHVDGPPRNHDWHSGWVAESVELLFKQQ